MLDAQILATAIKDRQAYDRIRDHVKRTEFSPPVAFWWDLVCHYYGRDPDARGVSTEILREQGAKSLTNPKHVEPMLAVLDSLPAEPACGNVVSLVLDLKRFNLAAEFGAAAMGGERRKADKLLAELNDVWDRTELGSKSDVEYALAWSDLDSRVGQHARVALGPPSLDDRIGGGVLAGNHVLIFGRTEIGKSCLVLSITANLLQAGQRVLYVGNEDEINVLKARLRLALLGWTQAQLNGMPKKATRLLEELVQDRLTMIHLSPGSISEIEDLAEKHTPTVLVLDQIRNLSGPEEAMTQRLEGNAIRFRSLISKRRLIGISVTQAGDRSQRHGEDGPIFLQAGDVDSSRVGLPAQADLMIGIGANRDMMARNQRILSFAKNKLSSGPAAREPLLLTFDFQRSKVYDPVSASGGNRGEVRTGT